MTEMVQRLRHDDILYDIGAFIGTFGISLAPFVQQVYLIEPDTTSLTELRANVEINIRRLPNLTIINKALGKQQETRTLFSSGQSDKLCPSFVYSKEHKLKQDLKVTTLDILRTILPIHPTVIKIDTEGWELDILLGAANSLKTIRLAGIECHNSITQAHLGYHATSAISDLMLSHNFVLVYSKERSPSTTHTIWERS